MKRLSICISAFVVAVGGILLACDDDDAGPSNGAPTNDADASANPVTLDDAGEASSSEGDIFNSVVLVNLVSGGLTASAFFAKGPNDGCIRSPAIEGCSYQECLPGSTTPTYDTPGAFTLTAGSPATTVTMMPSNGYFTGTSGDEVIPGLTFPSGSNVAIHVEGNVVPAFDDVVPVPAPFTWTSPPTTPVTQDLDRNADLPLAWTGQSSAVGFQIHVTTYETGAAVVHQVACDLAGTAESGKIASDLLKRLPAGQGIFSFWSEKSKIKTAGDYRVRETVRNFFENSHEVVVK